MYVCQPYLQSNILHLLSSVAIRLLEVIKISVTYFIVNCEWKENMLFSESATNIFIFVTKRRYHNLALLLTTVLLIANRVKFITSVNFIFVYDLLCYAKYDRIKG